MAEVAPPPRAAVTLSLCERVRSGGAEEAAAVAQDVAVAAAQPLPEAPEPAAPAAPPPPTRVVAFAPPAPPRAAAGCAREHACTCCESDS